MRSRCQRICDRSTTKPPISRQCATHAVKWHRPVGSSQEVAAINRRGSTPSRRKRQPLRGDCASATLLTRDACSSSRSVVPAGWLAHAFRFGTRALPTQRAVERHRAGRGEVLGSLRGSASFRAGRSPGRLHETPVPSSRTVWSRVRDDAPGPRDQAQRGRSGASRKLSTSAVNRPVAVSMAACRCPGMTATWQSGRAPRSASPAALNGSLLSPPWR